MGINYHPGKANVVADALSRKAHLSLMTVQDRRIGLCKEFEKLNLGLVNNAEAVVMEVDSTLEQEICKGQLEDEKILEIKQWIKEGKAPGFIEDENETVWFEK